MPALREDVPSFKLGGLHIPTKGCIVPALERDGEQRPALPQEEGERGWSPIRGMGPDFRFRFGDERC